MSRRLIRSLNITRCSATAIKLESVWALLETLKTARLAADDAASISVKLYERTKKVCDTAVRVNTF